MNITSHSKVPIVEYALCQRMPRKIEFKSIPSFIAGCAHIDILWEVSIRFTKPVPNWQGMMQSLYKNENHPWMSSLVFLPLIDMYNGDKTCILSTIHYICKLANEQNVTPVVTFDQPLFWKASEIKNGATDESAVRNVYNRTPVSTNVLPDDQRRICVFNGFYLYDLWNCYIEVKQIRP